MKSKSLRFKLIAGSILAVLLPLLAVGYFSVTRSSDALQKLARQQVVNLSKDLSGMTELVLKEELKMVAQISGDDSLRGQVRAVYEAGAQNAASAVQALDRRLTGVMKAIGHDYESMFIADANGRIYSDGNEGAYKEVSIGDREYFQKARQGDALVGTPIASKVTGEPVVPIAAPIHTAGGTFAGALISIVKTDFLAKEITSVEIGETGYPFMVDQNGMVIVHPDASIVLKVNVKKLPGMEEIAQAAVSGQTGVASYVYKGEEKIGGFAPVPLNGWSVITTQTADEFMGTANGIRNFITAMTVVFLAATVLVVGFFANGISRRVMGIVNSLNGSSEQVAAASSQVASTSQSLAEGSSEQASSLEETSSSLEEMAAQTRQNADNAEQADSSVKETAKVVENGVSSMERMNAAINEIKDSSNETSKIIKTIDDIAFQTNLLALNAAVEAARAGEAGKGFAVVAEEVRNLAQRSAEAAQNTAQLIEKSQENANNGVSVAEEVATQLNSIKDSSAKVNTLISEIAAASREQTQGIDQVNTAVSEMDKVVQKNAADSEESASAAEELSSQASEMERMVAELETVVSGQRSRRSAEPEAQEQPAAGTAARNRAPQLQRPKQAKQNQRATASAGRQSAASADRVIALDDKDFNEF